MNTYGSCVAAFHPRLLTFPVKYDWKDKASLKLIERSARQLKKLLDGERSHWGVLGIDEPVYLPKVGCGAGGLRWEEVKPILEKYLDDRFTICDIR